MLGGITQVDLIKGKASFHKLSISEVTSHFRNQ